MSRVLRISFLPFHLIVWMRVASLAMPAFLLTDLSAEMPKGLNAFLENHCMDCHDDNQAEGGLRQHVVGVEPDESDPLTAPSL